MEEIKSYFESKGLGAKDITKGVIAHEVLGIGVMLGRLVSSDFFF